MYYVAGFAFDGEGNVLLIEKRRPAFQAGRLNGLGGRVAPEDGGSCLAAMVREFEEECGLRTSERDWRHYVTIHNRATGTVVDFLVAFDVDLRGARTTTDESVAIYPANLVPQARLVEHVRWLLPLALDRYVDPVFVDYRREGA